MSSVVTFWSTMFTQISSFLMDEPMIYFVGLIMLCFIIGAFRKLISF